MSNDDYQIREFWNIKPKHKIVLNKCSCWKCIGLNEDPYKGDTQDSLADVIKTKEQADDFMNQLNFAIKQGDKKSKT